MGLSVVKNQPCIIYLVFSVQHSPSVRSLPIAIGLCLGLTSCNLVPQKINLTQPPFNCPPVSTASPASNLPSESLPLDIEIHVDGSGSMLGYVPENPVVQETVYTDTLEILHQVLTHPRTDSPPQYFRTGLNRKTRLSTEKFSFSDRTPGRLNPITKDFYKGNLTSQLQAAITLPENDRNKLLVLISDLDQDSGAINHVSKAIQEHFFNQQTQQNTSYGIALLGVRSEFDGTVFSTDPSKIANFSYKSTRELATYRPFYLLWVGPVTELNQYLPELVEKIEQKGGDPEVSLFSPEDLKAELRLNPQQIPADLPSSIAIRTLKKGQVVLVQEQAPGHLFSLSPRQTETIRVSYELTSSKEVTPYALKPGKIEAQAQSWDLSATSNPLERSSQEALAEMELTNFDFQNQSLNFVLSFHPEKIESSSLYVYRFDLVAKGLTSPQWWTEWDWDSRETPQDGSKTYQLSRFTDSLATITLEAMGQDKTIGSVCFAVQKY